MIGSSRGSGFGAAGRERELLERLAGIENQNAELAEKVDRLERVLSQQNLVLEKLLIGIGENIGAAR